MRNFVRERKIVRTYYGILAKTFLMKYNVKNRDRET